MNIQQLECRRREIRAEARAMLQKIKDSKSEAELRRLEAEHDDLMLQYDDVADQIEDIRSDAKTASDARLARRPGADPIEVLIGGEEAPVEENTALRPEHRMTAWAQARTNADDQYRSLGLGQYLRAMIVGGKSDIERRALSEGSDSAGGYTVPDMLSAQLIDLARARSVVMTAGAQTLPLGSDVNKIAKLLTDPAPAWRLEAGDVATSDPTFGLVTLTPRSLAVQTVISAELFEDSLNLATELPRVLGAAMAVELDRVALIGTGTAPEPRGVANTVGIGTHAQNAVTASWANLSRARTGILSANHMPSAYIMSPRDEGTFADLVDGTGQPLAPSAAVAAIPMLTTTSLPINGGTGTDESTIIAGDFTRLLIGIRSDIRVEVLKTSTYASNLQYTLLAHMRADVAVTHPGAFYTLTGVGREA
ncbi:phage major capsid protein [uncultured Roseovarius sp.]|uniref:phage major capsid protein n=1 Tax=uncultured Roseovarius sp. TaxID=293344 RepID=UPI00260C7718|nr:phage major capsid protein [uncultured Roseovarius sp.]